MKLYIATLSIAFAAVVFVLSYSQGQHEAQAINHVVIEGQGTSGGSSMFPDALSSVEFLFN